MNIAVEMELRKYIEERMLLEIPPHIYRQHLVERMLELGLSLEAMSDIAGIPLNDLKVFQQGLFSHFGGQFVATESVQRLELLNEYLENNNYLE